MVRHDTLPILKHIELIGNEMKTRAFSCFCYLESHPTTEAHSRTGGANLATNTSSLSGESVLWSSTLLAIRLCLVRSFLAPPFLLDHLYCSSPSLDMGPASLVRSISSPPFLYQVKPAPAPEEPGSVYSCTCFFPSKMEEKLLHFSVCCPKRALG